MTATGAPDPGATQLQAPTTVAAGEGEVLSRTRARGPARHGLLAAAERFALPAILVLMIVIFGSLNSTFVSWGNWQSILASQAVTLVIALALIVPLVGGNFDLSVGAVAILSSIVLADLQSSAHWGLVPSSLLGIAAGLGVGVINGALVTRFGLNSFIATLGTGIVLSGIVTLITSGNAIVTGISVTLTNFGASTLLKVPNLALVAIAFAIVITYVLAKTPYGRKLVAIGSNKSAAELVGIRVRRMVFSSFVVSGTLGGIAGVLLLAQQASGNPAADSLTILLPALAAVFLGASTLWPGQYNVPGTILGLLVVAALVSGLTLQGAATWVQPVATGATLIVAVGASEAFRRQRRQ